MPPAAEPHRGTASHGACDPPPSTSSMNWRGVVRAPVDGTRRVAVLQRSRWDTDVRRTKWRSDRDGPRFRLAQGTIPAWNTFLWDKPASANRDSCGPAHFERCKTTTMFNPWSISPWQAARISLEAQRGIASSFLRMVTGTSKGKLAHLKGSTRVPPILERSSYRLRLQNGGSELSAPR